MKKRITEYLAYIDALLEKEDVDWEHEKEKHLVQIAFFFFLHMSGRYTLLSWHCLHWQL